MRNEILCWVNGLINEGEKELRAIKIMRERLRERERQRETERQTYTEREREKERKIERAKGEANGFDDIKVFV